MYINSNDKQSAIVSQVPFTTTIMVHSTKNTAPITFAVLLNVENDCSLKSGVTALTKDTADTIITAPVSGSKGTLK